MTGLSKQHIATLKNAAKKLTGAKNGLSSISGY